MDGFLKTLKTKFNFDTEFFETLGTGEEPVKDIYVDYNIPYVGAFNLKVFEAKYFVDGVEFFRPFIRGFLVLLMALYNVRQVLAFIRQDAGVVTGKVAHGKDE